MERCSARHPALPHVAARLTSARERPVRLAAATEPTPVFVGSLCQGHIHGDLEQEEDPT